MVKGKRDTLPRTLADCMSYPLRDAGDTADHSTRHLGLEDNYLSQMGPKICDRSSPFTSKSYLVLWGEGGFNHDSCKPFCVRPDRCPRLLLRLSDAAKLRSLKFTMNRYCFTLCANRNEDSLTLSHQVRGKSGREKLLRHLDFYMQA